MNEELKAFIRDNFISKSNIIRHSKIKNIKLWKNYSQYYFEMMDHQNYMQYIFDILNDIERGYKCPCGSEMRFLSFHKGYTCSMGQKCKIWLSKKKKWVPTLETILKKLVGDKSLISEIENYIKFVTDLNIPYSAHNHYIKSLEKYVKYGIKNWYRRLFIYKRAIDNNIIKSKDSCSLAFHMVKYGAKGKKIFKERIEVISKAHWEGCLKRCDGDIEKAKELYDFENFKKGTSIEAFTYRCGGDVEKAKELYDHYWSNTTFSSSIESFKNIYGEDWEKYYNERMQMFRDIGKKLNIYDPERDLSEEDFIKKRKELYKKASKSSCWYTKHSKLIEEGYSYEEASEILRKKWDNTSLEFYIEKYGEEEGPKKYNERCSKMGLSEKKFIELYGEEEGIKRYSSYLKKLQKNSNFFGASKQSMEVFFPLIDWLLELEICTLNEICVGIEDSKEWFINSKTNGTYFYDFTIPNLKIIIEYNGEVFHPNPEWLDTDINKWNTWENPHTKEGADKVHKRDVFKRELAKSEGFAYLEIWSSKKYWENIEICKKFIQEILNDRGQRSI